MTILPVETRRSRDLNIALLFLVALEPYLFNQLFASGIIGNNPSNSSSGVLIRGSFQDISTTLFALDIGVIYGILALFSNLLAQEKKNLVAPELLGYYKGKRNVEVFMATAFFVSALPFFLGGNIAGGSGTFLFLARPVCCPTRILAPRAHSIRQPSRFSALCQVSPWPIF